MKFLYCILPLLGAVALSQGLEPDNCNCPQVRCRADDPVELCKCLNARETKCKQLCPEYKPVLKTCPKPSPTPKSTPMPKPTVKPVTCECIQVYCLQVWPGSCHCANNAKQACYDKCGGIPPVLDACPAEEVPVDSTPEPIPEPAPAPVPVVEPKCECEGVMCIQSWPESCYCANAAAESCYKKCGGKKPALQKCPAPTSKTLTTSTKPKPTKTSTMKTTSTPTPTTSAKTHKICGGGRASFNLCDEGYTCITDPYTPGCGPACDGLGICVQEKMCGGFAGFPCDDVDQLCLDDPRDDCDPSFGGADCAGLCVWPHKSLYGDEV